MPKNKVQVINGMETERIPIRKDMNESIKDYVSALYLDTKKEWNQEEIEIYCLKKYENFCHQVIHDNEWYLKYVDYEDFLQDLKIGIINGVRNWKKDKGSISTIVYYKVRYEWHLIKNKIFSWDNNLSQYNSSLDTKLRDIVPSVKGEDTEVDFYNFFISKENDLDLIIMLKKFIKELSDVEIDILKFLIQPKRTILRRTYFKKGNGEDTTYNMTSISKKYNVTTQTISNKKNILLKKLRKEFKDYDFIQE